ncbi:hypothetical protein P43SY_002363 [Pythium insidiosum]|uniref:Uncharacterized protein n=1 Tax=Pythium insidiosum TaxID=114742 RepID=A0AAD5LTN0_PYTIN|nr:hypothetical protein P43SY_002363 [Pythium insidiosum]
MQRQSSCWWLASWRKLEQEWQATSARAQQQLSKISESVQKTTYLEGDHWGSLSDCALLQERASSRLWELVHRCRVRLGEELRALRSIVVRMKALLHDDAALDDQAFLVELVAMYDQELLTKAMIAADVAECSSHETMTLYIASWQMQPHIHRARIDEILQLIQDDAHYSK